jgi:N6-adenosine-specific RNA methylase IME4
MKYNIILADPAWQYNDNNCDGRGAGAHYTTMTLDDICRLPVKEVLADDAVLFLWATYPLIQHSFKVMEAWDFTYKTIAFQWVKLNKKNKEPFFGLGRWTRGNTECCLLGIRGKPKRVDASVSQLIFAPIGRHSAKPPETRTLIHKLMGPLPSLELFAREKVDGWDALGYDVGVSIEDGLKQRIGP